MLPICAAERAAWGGGFGFLKRQYMFFPKIRYSSDKDPKKFLWDLLSRHKISPIRR